MHNWCPHGLPHLTDEAKPKPWLIEWPWFSDSLWIELSEYCNRLSHARGYDRLLFQLNNLCCVYAHVLVSERNVISYLPNCSLCLICLFPCRIPDCMILAGWKCTSTGPVIRPEKGQCWDSVPVCHTHHLCREQPWDTQGDMGKMEV